MISCSALWALVNLTCDTDIATIFGSIGGIVTLVDLLEARQSDDTFSPVLNAALCVVRNLSSATSYNYNIFASTSVCKIVSNVLMKFYTSDVAAGEISLNTISNLSCDEELSTHVAKIDGCFEIILKALHHYSATAMYTANLSCGEIEDDGPVSAAIWAVRNLAGSRHDNQLKLCDLGALGMLANVFEFFPGQYANICGAILNLVADNDAGKFEAKQFGLCDKVVGAVTNSITDASVCLFGAKAIANLARNNTYNTRRLTELKACELTVKALEAHKEHIEVSLACCDVLLHLHYTSDEMKDALAVKGVLSEDRVKATCSPEATFEDIYSIWIVSDATLSKYSNIK